MRVPCCAGCRPVPIACTPASPFASATAPLPTRSTSLVTFTPLTTEMIEWYVATGEPLDKAGAYAVRGTGGVFVQRVQGSVSNVIGLPLHTVVRLAAELGVVLLG